MMAAHLRDGGVDHYTGDDDSIDSLDRMVREMSGEQNGCSAAAAAAFSPTDKSMPVSPSLTVGTADLSGDFGNDDLANSPSSSPSAKRNRLAKSGGGGGGGGVGGSSRRAFAGLRDSLAVRSRKKNGSSSGGTAAVIDGDGHPNSNQMTNGTGGVTFVEVVDSAAATDGKKNNKSRKKKTKKGGLGSSGGGGGGGGIANPFRKRYDRLADPSAVAGEGGTNHYEPPPTFDVAPPPTTSPADAADGDADGESATSRGRRKEAAAAASEGRRSRSRSRTRDGIGRARSRSRSLLRGVKLPSRSSRGGSATDGSARGGSARNAVDGGAAAVDDDDNSTASDSLEALAEEDPLIDLFETHNTKRVVFDPTFVTSSADEAGGPSSSGRGGVGSSFNIKGFMNRIIHKDGKEKEAEVAEISSAIDDADADADEPTFDGTPSPVPSPSARPRAGSALRSGRNNGRKGSQQQQQQSASTKTAKFDPYIIEKAKSRSTTTAAVAAAAITRSGSSAAFKQQGGGSRSLAIRTAHTPASSSASTSFKEDPDVTKRIERLLGRANRAHTRTYRYEHAIGYYLAALDILTKEGYPEEHELVTKSVRKLNDCHHAQSSLKNSANIVKMGIKHENRGEFVRALKMYTIAYRIRRDALSKFHPSLPVLLNMLGSVQVKRGELKEAMQIYELALNGRPDDMRSVSERRKAEMIHPMTKSVTLRDMGMIYERWGDDDKALQLYEESLAYVMKSQHDLAKEQQELAERDDGSSEGLDPTKRGGTSLLSRSRSIVGRVPSPAVPANPKYVSYGNEGEMEVYLESSGAELQTGNTPGSGCSYKYDTFFPPTEYDKSSKKNKGKSRKNRKDKTSEKDNHSGREGLDVNVAITLHQIAQINRRRGHHDVALSAYQVALRGMKQALGDRHPNVAAILGNLGNLHKEMGNFDVAYSIYQEVLGIETHHLGLCHPEVSVTLHNIATIESSRGRYSDAITLYTQVIKMQKSLFGPNHISVAVTSSCMGDVYERMGDTKNAMNMYEETLRIRMEIMGRQHVDVGRLLHKLGCLALQKGDYRTAEVYVTKATAVYISNKLDEDHPWMRDIRRNEADIKGLLATGLSDDFGEL